MKLSEEYGRIKSEYERFAREIEGVTSKTLEDELQEALETDKKILEEFHNIRSFLSGDYIWPSGVLIEIPSFDRLVKLAGEYKKFREKTMKAITEWMVGPFTNQERDKVAKEEAGWTDFLMIRDECFVLEHSIRRINELCAVKGINCQLTIDNCPETREELVREIDEAISETLNEKLKKMEQFRGEVIKLFEKFAESGKD